MGKPEIRTVCAPVGVHLFHNRGANGKPRNSVTRSWPLKYAIPVGTASTTADQMERIRNRRKRRKFRECACRDIDFVDRVQATVRDEPLVADNDQVEGIECITKGGGRFGLSTKLGKFTISSIWILSPAPLDSVTFSPCANACCCWAVSVKPVVIASAWALI